MPRHGQEDGKRGGGGRSGLREVSEDIDWTQGRIPSAESWMAIKPGKVHDFALLLNIWSSLFL